MRRKVPTMAERFKLSDLYYLVQHGRNNPAVSKHSKALRRKIFAFYLLPFDLRVAALAPTPYFQPRLTQWGKGSPNSPAVRLSITIFAICDRVR